MSTMSSFPLSTIPHANLKAVLSKMPFKESTRMRGTCRQMNDTIDKSENFVFPLFSEWGYMLMIFWNGSVAEDTNIEPCLHYFHSRLRCGGTVRFDKSISPANCAPAHYIEKALFDRIMFRISASRGQPIASPFRLLPYLRQAKIRCRLLDIQSSVIEASEVNLLANILRPKSILLRKNDFPIPFDILADLSIKCPEITIDNCDTCPPDYVSVLSQYKSVRIVSVESKSMPSLVSLIRLWLSNPSSPLKHFDLPYYNRDTFLTPEEVEELDLEQWRIRRNKREDGFVIETDKEYITLTGHPNSMKRSCIGHRMPKMEINPVITYWMNVFFSWIIPPYDASDLYDSIEKHDYSSMKNCLELMSTFDTSPYGIL